MRQLIQNSILPKGKNESLWVIAVSALAAALTVLLAVCTQPVSEINDDAEIQWIIGTVGEFSPYQHPVLSAVVRALSFRRPGLCWFVILQFILACFGLWAMLWAVYKLGGLRACPVGWLICISAAWCGVLKYYTFTRTSPFLLSAGCMLALCAILRKGPVPLYLALGTLLAVLGMFFRYEAVLAVFPFFGLLTLCLLWKREKEIQKNIKRLFIDGMPMWACMAAVLVVMAGGRLYLAFVPGWEDYLEFDMARGEIQDYESQDRWGQASEAYEALGIDQISFEMLMNWNNEDTDVFTTDTLKQIAAQRHFPKHPLEKLPEIAGELHSGLYLVAVAASVALLYTGLGSLAYLSAGFLCTAGLFAVQVFSGRIVARSLDAVLMGLIFAMAALFSCREKPHEHAKLCFLSAAVCIAICAVPVIHAAGSFMLPNLSQGIIKERQEAMQQMCADTDHIYLLAYSSGFYLDDVCGIWGALPSGSADNVYWLGGCYMRSPKVREKLKDMGIDNPMTALFTDDRVLSSKSKLILKYLQTHYDSAIERETVFSFDFTDIVRYFVSG